MWIKVVCLNLQDRYEALLWASGNFLHKNIHTVPRVRSFFAQVKRDYSINVENDIKQIIYKVQIYLYLLLRVIYSSIVAIPLGYQY